MATTTSTPQAILDAVGGAENITHLTHCATRLRFELKDASVVDKGTVEKIPGVMGAVPQSGDRYQIIIGGAVQSVYNDIMKLPAMAGGASSSAKSDADIKAAARAKARGKNAYVDAFFEYLSDAFRPLLPVLLGASLILALIAVLEAFGVVDTHAKVLPSWLVFTNTMWRSVFYFLPAMVAYNAAKKLDIDPWVGAAVVLALLTPEYTALKGLKETTCTKSSVGSDLCTTEIFGLPMKWSDYGGQVFLPLIMVPILALVYRSLKKVIPANVQMVFVPFFSFLVMVPVSAFLIGPFSLWLGNSIGSGLSWLNTTAPIVFAIFIPLLYPFLVPLGLHWPLNALQLANIAGPAHADFIQGPMGTWNFACFGATLGVLILTLRNGDKELRQTASGALAAGLFGGISEPSLYGIHLRFKRIYPLMLTGCAAGGLTIGVISWISGSPVLTGTFVFTSLLTIPVFHPTVTYAISIAVAFFVSAFMVVTFGYQSKEEKEAAAAEQEEAPKAEAAAAAAPAEAAPKAELVAGQEVVLTAPLNGTVVALEDVPDPVFSSGAVGKGAGIEPSDGASIKVVAPADGSVVVAPSSGHAYGLALDNGLEILIHVGIDTVNLEGKGFDVKVGKGDRVKAGQTLVVVDRAVIEEAGYKLVTPVLVTNYMNFAEVEVIANGSIKAGTDLVKATK
ncbi:sodium pump decarboxylase, gamma subunit [Actinomyces graevenitzii F0530]|uniref:Sodium pump decarboxylase, gamma subunit n=1 Tax=Actinomyces graevenitzii F0530 TaxID=1321817 RepID=U1Q3C8_9ACTO|nr:glucose PTS transporter subunit IIA [Actinomyces graevenitzii]ERH17066.1 sodium pump decarboxylase, gamma subunit [Actinomyces graevenitzii F0530]